MDNQSRPIDKKALSNKLEEYSESVHAISQELSTLVENATHYLGETKKHDYTRKSKRIRELLEDGLRSQLLLLRHELSRASINFVYASPEMWEESDEQTESGNPAKDYPGNYNII